MARRHDFVEAKLVSTLDRKPREGCVRMPQRGRGDDTYLVERRRAIAKRVGEFLPDSIADPDSISHITSDEEAEIPEAEPIFEFVTEDGTWRVVDCEILEELMKLLSKDEITLLRIRRKGSDEDGFKGKLVYRAPSMFVQELEGRTSGRRHEISLGRCHIMTATQCDEPAVFEICETVSEGTAAVVNRPGSNAPSLAESRLPVLGRRRRYISGRMKDLADENAKIVAEKEAERRAKIEARNARVRERYRARKIAETGEFHEDMGEAIRFGYNRKVKACVINFLESVAEMSETDIASHIESFRGEIRDTVLAVVQFDEKPTVTRRYMGMHNLAERIANKAVLGPTRSRYKNGDMLLRALAHQYSGVGVDQLMLLPFSFRQGSRDLFEIVDTTNAFLKRKNHNLRVHIRGGIIILGPANGGENRPKRGIIATGRVENTPESPLVEAYL